MIGLGVGDRLADERLDLGCDVVDHIGQPDQVYVAVELDKSCIGYQLLAEPRRLYRGDEVAFRVQDEGWHADRGKRIADVDLGEGVHERGGRTGARRGRLQARPELPRRWISGPARR